MSTVPWFCSGVSEQSVASGVCVGHVPARGRFERDCAAVVAEVDGIMDSGWTPSQAHKHSCNTQPATPSVQELRDSPTSANSCGFLVNHVLTCFLSFSLAASLPGFSAGPAAFMSLCPTLL
eukprot:3525887-Rhodomonas_salina.1